MKRLVVWGGRENLDSLRHVLRAYHQAALKLGIDAEWVEDKPDSAWALTPGTTVLAADVLGRNLPYVRDVDYVLHNWDGASPLCRALEQTPERLLRLQVWTVDATGEEWDRFRQFDRDARTLFQPWGADLLAEEFLPPVYNPQSIEVSFVGAVWSEQYQGVELGNEQTIRDLRTACMARGLRLTLRTQISDDEMIAVTRAARLAPAFAGRWQVEKGYLPCRVFKNVAYGVLAVTNVPQANNLMGPARMGGETLEEILDAALSLNQTRYLNFVREQQRVVQRYTYRESLEAIDRAFEEIRP